MPVNQVYKSTGEKIIDISDSTVTAANMAQGVTAYDASGAKITGSMQGGLEMNVKFTTNKKVIPAYMFYNNHGSGSTNSTYPIEEVVIGDGITSISDYAFAYCSSLANVTISNGVTSIGERAFGHCTSLANITIPDSVTEINSQAFYYCYGLTSVTLGSGVKSIGSSAFYNCSNIKSITIPNSIRSIESNSFNQCSRLRTITINKPQGSIYGAPWGATYATVIWTG